MGFDIDKNEEGKNNKSKKGFSLEKRISKAKGNESQCFDLDKDDSRKSRAKNVSVSDGQVLSKSKSSEHDKSKGSSNIEKKNFESDSNNEQSKSSKKGLIIGVAVIAVLAVILFINFSTGEDQALNSEVDKHLQESPEVENTVSKVSENLSENIDVLQDETNEEELVTQLSSEESLTEDSSEEGTDKIDDNIESNVEDEMVANPVISFSKGSANQVTIRNEDLVSKIVKYLINNPAKSLVIYVYSSSEGRISLNQKLSKNRADKFAAILEARGISSSGIRIVGKGGKNPIASNDNEEGGKRIEELRSRMNRF